MLRSWIDILTNTLYRCKCLNDKVPVFLKFTFKMISHYFILKLILCFKGRSTGGSCTEGEGIQELYR